MSLLLKKQINKEISNAGLAGSVEGAAIQRLADAIIEENSVELIHRVLEICRAERSSGSVTAAQVDAALAQLKGGAQATGMVNVVNAFAVPKISYDPVGRKMFTDTAPKHLFASAEAKQKLYLDRLQLIGQRMRRNRLFQQHNQLLSGSFEEHTGQLTDLQSLRGVLNQPRIVMGCITKAEDDRRFVLEDASGSVPLDLSEAVTTAGFFTENCVVVAEGELCHDGAFHVRALGFPPTESRSELPMASQRLNFFGGPNLSEEELKMIESLEKDEHLEDRIVVCANIWLDRPETLEALTTLFAGYQDAPVVPAMFVFMGNFHSRGGSGAVGKGGASAACSNSAGGSAGGAQAGAAGASYSAIKTGFNKLASLLQQFPRIQNNSHFVFIPGPGDPCPGDVLPQPPLPSYFTEQLRAVLPNVSFASNPCRLRFYSQQLVFFRYDILKRMRRRCIIPPTCGESADANTMWQHLTLTLLQQSHLCPLPLLQQPIYWQFDHAMHLYPLPHAVVVADTSPQAQHNHQGCSMFNPGSFADGFFAAYVPFKQGMEMEGEADAKAVEMCEMPRDGQLEPYEEDEEGGEDGSGHGAQAEALPQGGRVGISGVADYGDGDGDDGDNADEEHGDGPDAGERDEGYYSTLTHGLGFAGSTRAMATQAGASIAERREPSSMELRPPPPLARQDQGREDEIMAGEEGEEDGGIEGQQGVVSEKEHRGGSGAADQEGVPDWNGDVEMVDENGREGMGQGGPDHREEDDPGSGSGGEDGGDDFPEIMD